MKIYSTYEAHQSYLKEHLPKGFEVVEQPKEAQWLITGTFNADQYHPNLEGIIVPFSGTDRIDRKTLKKHNLKLFNTTIHAIYVAEMAVKLTLGVLGQINTKDQLLSQGDWSDRNSDKPNQPWITLIDKKVGIYGFGHIGRHIKQLLSSFTKTFYTIDRGKDYADCLLVSDLATLVEKSDVVIVATPLNPSTKHSINHDILSTMQDTYLINVGRGDIIQEDALYEALKNGTLKGFASDVWFHYPSAKNQAILPSKYPIHRFDNVLMSPHCGGFSEKAPTVMKENVLERLLAIKEGDYTGQIEL